MPGGQLIVVTDHFDYFRHIRRVLHEAKGFVRIAMPQMTDAAGELVGTNFERKYIAQGRPFYDTALMLRTGYETCEALNYGDGNQVMAEMVTHKLDIDMMEARIILFSAVEALCPWHDHR